MHYISTAQKITNRTLISQFKIACDFWIDFITLDLPSRPFYRICHAPKTDAFHGTEINVSLADD
jgi:hypothetical protein